MPQAVADVLGFGDVESLRAAANEALDAREHEQLMEESQTHLTKFIKSPDIDPISGGRDPLERLPRQTCIAAYPRGESGSRQGQTGRAAERGAPR